MRVCLVYDCLFPYTVGGAERWYRGLAERLASAGHDVTYLTLRQWDTGEEPQIAGVRVVAVGPRMELYTGGRRRIIPPLRFGAGVLTHLARHGRRYDVVHTDSFPYFSLLAAAIARTRGRYELVVDWPEVWSESYWREYLGRAGAVGFAVQRSCARVRQRAFCFSAMHAERLREEGMKGELSVLRGLYAGPSVAPTPIATEPLVVFAGRQIPEKRAQSVAPAVGLAAKRVPELHGVVFGDGPEHAHVLAGIAALERPELVSAPGFVESERVHEALRRALCMLLPSRREGYGLIVVEAAACGTPSVVVRGVDNAATELIEEDVNGVIAESASAEHLAAAIVRVYEGGAALRARTRAWFDANVHTLSIEHSLEMVLERYARPRTRA